MDNKELLSEEIRETIEVLGELEVGTEDYKVAVDGLTKLMDREIELKKLELDARERELAREDEKILKLAEMESENRDRLIKNILTGASIVSGIGLTVWGTLKSLKFEETGTVTTTIGRGFINKLLPRQK